MNKKVLGLTWIEISLIQILIYVVLWVLDEYFATLFSILIAAILTGILLVSIAAELIEPSKVPGSYFKFIAISIVVPVVIFAIYFVLNDFELLWLQE